MDTKWKKFSHGTLTKVIAFIIAVACFSGVVTILFDFIFINSSNIDLSRINQKSYYVSTDYINDCNDIIGKLRNITNDYKSEANILSGGTVTAEAIKSQTDSLYQDFSNSSYYNANLNEAENYNIFQTAYADQLAQIKDRLTQNDMQNYHAALNGLAQYKGLVYYVKNGETVFANTSGQTAEYFKTFPAYIILSGYNKEVYPVEVEDNLDYSWFLNNFTPQNQQDVMYVAFNSQFLNPRLDKWEAGKIAAANNFNLLLGLSVGFILAFVYLLWVVGRRSPDYDQVSFLYVDRLYNDVNLCLCGLLIAAEIGALVGLHDLHMYAYVYPVSFVIAALGLMLVLAMVKHIKNHDFFKHTVICVLFNKLFVFIKDIYNTGSTAVKVCVILVVYPLIAGLTFFMLPLTIIFACWLALKEVKKFSLIKDGLRKVKEGDLHHTIDIPGDGELAQLAADINGFTEGLNRAVANEVKSERMKSELITNVSHDLRTPLTAIITYVDLLKQESDPDKIKEYVDILDQKSQRLKTLTDDLFEAAKVSSGSLPVNFETIDIVALISQGLGELDEKIRERQLEFKLNYARDKMLIQADGKLLWRAVENLLSNILKYAQEGSRVYIDLEDAGSSVTLTMKNISAFELNVSAEELMERFKRGDESRSSQGSGLGLSIAKSMIEIQQGNFRVDIDGDLFKVTIQMKSSE